MTQAANTQAVVFPAVSSKAGLLKRSAAALAVGIVLVAGVIMPAEYGIDPTGFGQLTGLIALSRHVDTAATVAPVASAGSEAKGRTAVPITAPSYPTAFRSDTIDIPLGGGFGSDSELEYKVKMKAGDTLVYSWTSPANVYYDFHGESYEQPKPRVISYRIENEAKQSHGALTAPYDGIHGWFLQNHSKKPIVVRLKLSGFYELRADNNGA